MSSHPASAGPPQDAGSRILQRFLAESADVAAPLHAGTPPLLDALLPSRLSVGGLAWASTAAVALAAGFEPGSLSRLSPERIALAFRSDRVLEIEGSAPTVWSPYSGFWETGDGWIRTHGNYPHHAAALLSGLGLPSGADEKDVARRLRELSRDDAVRAIIDARGLAVPVLPESPQADDVRRSAALVVVERHPGSPSHAPALSGRGAPPLRGIRVLDLTRVIAGPVCTRTLALLGAEVLRIDPPSLEEPFWQHLDTGHGKRTALLDARGGALESLLNRADVVVLGYRPDALARLGLDPRTLIARHPGLIVLQLSAWGLDQPQRAGFDSLVQAESGIALIESSDGSRPGALPAQALDHSAGHLLAATALTLVERRRREGDGWYAHTSLRRIAAELLGLPRRSRPLPAQPIDPTPHTARFSVGGRTVTTVRPAIPWLDFTEPRPWGGDQPRW